MTGAGNCRQSKQYAQSFGLLLAVSALHACAVATPASIVSSTEQPIEKVSIRLQPAGDDNPQRLQFETALRQSFEKHSVTVDPAATVIADYAISVRPSDLGLVDAAAITDEATQIIWVSAPRRSRSLDKCAAIRLRATLAMFRMSDGKITYRGSAESDRCEVTDSAIADLADALIADAIAKTRD